MSSNKKIVLVGHLFVDVTFTGPRSVAKLRLGGIFHAARALWALNIPYVLAYFCPDYMEESVIKFAAEHGNPELIRLGTVTGCPNVMTIQSPKETGCQHYDDLLRDDRQTTIDHNSLYKVCAIPDVSDYLIFTHDFDLTTLLTSLKDTGHRIHADVNFQNDDFGFLSALGRPLETIILSTSSPLFSNICCGTCATVVDKFSRYTKAVLLKENRGGSRFFDIENSQPPILVEAQPRLVAHSVGVGDCFDAAMIAFFQAGTKTQSALACASCIAAEYAATTYPDDFKKAVERIVAVGPEVVSGLRGISLPWESRPNFPIYLAAPDFSYVDRTQIDLIDDSLKYHNFVARRPVQENGQCNADTSPEHRQKMCDADVKILDECRVLLAVLLFNDPGTLIEIGLAVERGMPVIVFDPYRIADNLMLTQLPDLVSSNIDEVINCVFQVVAKEWVEDGKP